MLPEITDPVDLCDARGRLNPAAVGWTRSPLHRPDLRRWGRRKRWEYWGLVTRKYMIGLTISSLDYAGVESVYVLDRSTGRERTKQVVVPLARGVQLQERSGAGTSRVRTRGLRMEFADWPGGTRIRAETRRVLIDVVAARPARHESLGVVVPWGPRQFQYTVKDVARPLSGRLVIAGARYDVRDGWAVLDHGRGRMPREVTWNWAAGCGRVHGQVRGIQLGGRWTDGTGSTENALLTGRRLHYLGDDLTWEYDEEDRMRPWRVRGDRVEATFTPFHERAESTNLVLVAGETHQCFGHFAGWAVDDAGHRVVLDGLTGWAEEAHNRW